MLSRSSPPAPAVAGPAPIPDPDLGRLPPRATPRFASWLIVGMSGVYAYFSHRELSHIELWSHLSYGREIWHAAAIPATEPLLPLSAGVELIDVAWLSQVALYAAYGLGGDAALQCLHALLTTLCLALLAIAIDRRTASPTMTVAGLIVFGWVAWEPLRIAGPRVAGLACFIALFGILTSRWRSRAATAVVPLLLALWANLDASFALGLVLLCLFAAGRAVDVSLRSRRPGAFLFDRETRRLAMLAQLSAAAALVNPYGFRIFPHAVALIRSANLASLDRWAPLTLRSRQGLAVAAAVALLGLLYRLTPRRVPTSEFLTGAALGAATLWTSAAVLWWAVPIAYYSARHGRAIVRQGRLRARRERFPRDRRRAPPARPRAVAAGWLPDPSVLCVPIVGLSIAVSPLGPALRGVVPTRSAANYSLDTPVGAADYLEREEHRGAGLVFGPLEWGDYLTWRGAGRTGTVASSQVHLIPVEVLCAYDRIISISDGWERELDTLGVDAVVASPREQADLVGRLRRTGRWYAGHDDGRSVVFLRRVPLD